MFILCNGSRTVEEVLAATAGIGIEQADVEYLLAQGFLSTLASEQQADTSSAPLEAESMPAELVPLPLPVRSPQQRYLEAKPLATQLTASLGLRGFMLNLSVEGAAGYQDLVKLLPKIQAAVGAKACRALARALLE